eukprot:5955572-Amphidinium_carterae.1
MLNVTSTKIRAALEQKKMPLIYSEKAQQLIKDFLGWKGVLRPIPLKTKKAATAASSSSVGVADMKVKPASKRAVAKPVITLTEGPLAAAGSSGSTMVEQDSRPPLKRIRPTLAEQTTEEDRSRPPLPRRRAAIPPPAAVEQQVELGAEVPVPPMAYMLRTQGVMKLQPPLRTNLRIYWQLTALPLCRLLKVSPVMLARRGPDLSLRLSYLPISESSACSLPPLVLFATVADVVEIGRNLDQIADRCFYCASLAFNLTCMHAADLDPDTHRGVQVKELLAAAIRYAAHFVLISEINVAFVLMEAQHVVILACPLYVADAIALAEDIREHLVRYIDIHRQDGQVFSIDINQERTCYVTGGGPCSTGRSPPIVQGGMVGTKAKTPKNECADFALDENMVVFSPEPECEDQVAACVAWVLSGRRPRNNAAFEQFRSDLRVTARRWLQSAAKHSYTVSGSTLVTLSVQSETGLDEFIEDVCAPDAAEHLVVHFIYAVSCFLCIKLDVIDQQGRRRDGYLRTASYGMFRMNTCWKVFPPATIALPSCSPTLAFIPSSQSSSSSDQVLEVLPYSGVTGDDDRELEACHLVHGGMMAPLSGKSRSSSPQLDQCNSNLVLDFPCWKLSGEDVDGAHTLLHISCTGHAPNRISVPSVWTASDIQWMIARHLGAAEQWLEFTWVDDDLSIEAAPNSPLVIGQDAFPRLQAGADGLTTNKAVEGPMQELMLGCGPFDYASVTQVTTNSRDAVKCIARLVAELFPGIAFRSIVLLRAPQGSSSGGCWLAPASEFIVFPTSASGSRLWFQSPTGSDTEPIEGKSAIGTWIELNRLVCVTAAAAYKIHLSAGQSCFLVYKTCDSISRNALEELVHLEFPLDDDDIRLLSEVAEEPEWQQHEQDLQHGRTPRTRKAAPTTTPIRLTARPIGAPTHAPARAAWSQSAAAADPEKQQVSEVPAPDPLSFEAWVRHKLEGLERAQQEILGLLRSSSSSTAAPAPHGLQERPARAGISDRLSNTLPTGAKPRSERATSSARSQQRIVPIRKNKKKSPFASRGKAHQSTGLVKGGGRSAPVFPAEHSMWMRSITRHKQMALKKVLICCGKAKPVFFSYSGRISTNHIIEAYAAEKRIGRPYLAVQLKRRDGTFRSISYRERP